MGCCGSCIEDGAKKDCSGSSNPPLISPQESQKYDFYGSTVAIDGFAFEGAKSAIDLTDSPESGEECGNNNASAKSKSGEECGNNNAAKSKSRSRRRMKSNVGPRSGTRIKMKRGIFTGASGTFIRTNGTKYVVRMDGGRGVVPGARYVSSRMVAKDDTILL